MRSDLPIVAVSDRFRMIATFTVPTDEGIIA